jgi:hypothetical protein
LCPVKDNSKTAKLCEPRALECEGRVVEPPKMRDLEWRSHRILQGKSALSEHKDRFIESMYERSLSEGNRDGFDFAGADLLGKGSGNSGRGKGNGL